MLSSDENSRQHESRQHEALARQCLAETLAAVSLHVHAGPDRRERVLNESVERALHAYEGFRRYEATTRQVWADGSRPYAADLHVGLARTAQLHLQIGRSLVGQLDAANLDRLTVRNALAFRQAFAGLTSLEALDHGLPTPALLALARTALTEHEAGDTQAIDPDDTRNGVQSFRTWDFIKRTASLPSEVQTLAGMRYRHFFGADDRHPALGGRQILGGRRVDAGTTLELWSVEISFDYRAFALLFDETSERPRRYLWFWIGSVDEWLAQPPT